MIYLADGLRLFYLCTGDLQDSIIWDPTNSSAWMLHITACASGLTNYYILIQPREVAEPADRTSECSSLCGWTFALPRPSVWPVSSPSNNKIVFLLHLIIHVQQDEVDMPKSCNSHRKSNKMQECIKILFHIYMKLNMFWATHRPSSGA
jgi:hypothetical protein